MGKFEAHAVAVPPKYNGKSQGVINLRLLTNSQSTGGCLLLLPLLDLKPKACLVAILRFLLGVRVVVERNRFTTT
jgi:hypothetical protein